MNKRCSCVVLKENVFVVHYNSGRGKTGRCALYFRTEGVSSTKFEAETTVLCALEVLPLKGKKKGYQLKVMHFFTNLSTLKNDNTNSLQQKHLRRNYLEIRLGLNFIFTFFPVHFSKKM